MSNTEHPAGAAHRSFRCTFGPVREVDLVWPPPDADIDAFSVVHLDDGDAQPPRVEPPPIEPPPSSLRPPSQCGSRSSPVAPRRIKPTFGDCRALGAAPRLRPLVVPMEPPPVPGPAVPDEPVVGPPPAIPEEALVADTPADDTAVAAAEAPPLPDSPGHAALGSRDSRRPSIGVAGGVLRGGVRPGDGRRVSRRRHLAIGRARGAARTGRRDRGGCAGAAGPPRPAARGTNARDAPSVPWPPRRPGRFLRRRRSWRARPSRRPWRRRLPGRASRSSPPGARPSRSVRSRRT